MELTEDEIKSIKALIESLGSRYVRKTDEGVRDKRAKKTHVRNLLAELSGKYASYVERPSDEDLRRMYDVVQADAGLTKRLSGLGFGNTGDAYRKAALKLRIVELMRVLNDGKNVRNGIVHRPGYVPSASDVTRTLQEYEQADRSLSEYLQNKSR